jgi:hypothetical protein
MQPDGTNSTQAKREKKGRGSVWGSRRWPGAEFDLDKREENIESVLLSGCHKNWRKTSGYHAFMWLLDISLTMLIAMPITDSWMFRSQIEAFEDFRTISKYTPANPEVKQPDADKPND